MIQASLFEFDDRDIEGEILRRQSDTEVVLRPYQTESVDAAFGSWESGDCSTMVVLPTGTGKSVVFSEIMRRWMEKRDD